MRQNLLENKTHYSTYFKSIDTIGNGILELQKIDNSEIDDYYKNYIKPHIKETINSSNKPERITKIEKSDKKVVIKDSCNDVEKVIVVEEMISKQNKKYYLKMNEQEREYDDYLDKLNEYFYSKNDSYLRSKESNINVVYPAIGKIKNIEERREVMKTELTFTDNVKSKILSKGGLCKKKERKKYVNEAQYKEIEERVMGRKTGEKNKQDWIVEMIIIVNAIKFSLDSSGDESFKRECVELEAILESYKKETVLAGYVLSVLMVVQALMFRVDGEILDELFEFKKVIISFFDYYRK